MLNGKKILITGGTGSFGKAFVKEALKHYQPDKLIIYSRDEFKQYQMRQLFDSDKLRFFIGDVRDEKRLYRALSGVDFVIHAAAMKHVGASEYNPTEAIKTNINGAQNLINTALEAGVQKVIALSTDKACNPVNLYGATKLCSDKLFIAGNSYTGNRNTKFSVVRYGNVLGSRGSVIPLFMELAKKGEDLPITDERMTRFWITLPQAVDFVIQSFAMMRGGELFIPKIPSMRITDLATAIAPDCKFKNIGIRAGEKLHEVMISRDDSRHLYLYENRYIKLPDFSFWGERMPLSGSTLVTEGFEYASDSNDEWLGVEDLRRLLTQEGVIE